PVAIQAKRVEVLLSTYDFVHEKYLEQVDHYRQDRRNPLFDSIPRNLENELGIKIIRKDPPSDLAKITSSSRLLDIVDSAIQVTLEPFRGALSEEPAPDAQRLVSPAPSEQLQRTATHHSRHSP